MIWESQGRTYFMVPRWDLNLIKNFLLTDTNMEIMLKILIFSYLAIDMGLQRACLE